MPPVFRVLLHPCLVLAVVAVLGTDGCGASTPISSSTPDATTVSDGQPTFTRLYSSATSGYAEAGEQVLRTPAELATAWRAISSGTLTGPVPTVDFNRQMVILLALGQRRTGGYSVRFDGVTTAGGSMVVRYTTTSPGPGCGSTQSLTAPVEVVAVPRVDGAVRFDRTEVVSSC